MRILLARAAVLAMSLGCLSSAAAQDGSTGAIRGSVLDPSGARMVGVQVSIIDPETAFTRRVLTDKEGRFTANFLPAGSYDVTANANGISKSFVILRRKGVFVEIGGAVDLELTL